METFNLKAGLRIGVASAPTQIEGGDVEHSWNEWADRGMIKDNTSPRRAAGHFQLWQEDIKLMRKMRIKAYRMGLEWARIEPRQGEFDQQAIDFYRK